MSTMRLSKWGTSLAFRISKQILDSTHWQEGDQFMVTLEDDALTLQKVCKPKNDMLDEILNNVESIPKEDIIDWGAPVGKEVW